LIVTIIGIVVYFKKYKHQIDSPKLGVEGSNPSLPPL
jgi:hypothetical protein